MKTIKKLLPGFLVIALFFTTNAFGQEEPKEEFEPVYITVTTTSWNSDADKDFSDWLETEKEYFAKVTMKNDLIIGSGFYTHYFTADNSEVVLVSMYKSWNDIEAANDVSSNLAKEAWPDDEERKAFFEKRNNYYSPQHYDEIYTSTPYSKELETESTEPLVYYVKKNEMSLDGEGDPKKFKEYSENVTKKNSFVKGYFSHRHLWGSNSREFSEVFVFDHFADIEKSFEENVRLSKEHWPDEEQRNAFFKEMNKLFTGKHGDYIYQSVPELSK